MLINTPVNAINNDAPLEGINWNDIGDSIDNDIWDRLTTNFWLPEKIPVSNDVQSWRNMTAQEQDATLKVFTGLTVLDTLQGTVGAVSLIPHAVTPQEEAVYTNIAFMESVHAKSYSNIFMTLASTPEIDEAFRWARENEHMQYKARKILSEYASGEPEKMFVASVMLESFLFYSGFYLPLRMASTGKITNAADIIRLIIRDEAIHGYYIGYKYQNYLKNDKARHAANQDEIVDLLLDLYDNESHFTEAVYDQIGWTEDVKAFLRYNANKAMNNLGYEAIFPQEECKFNAGVMTSLDPSANENHDFFSGSGSSYVIGKAEETTDDDWDF
ncbi:class 1b ribonucleoside-diphosphate reductase subunit beta [Corynebacterium ammoniagenes]|uniref:Ribonucleoside-diphosphate reductase subunit beta n=2 Tax=Corynebacterium ammoniagenes TaxID=1697 RepID=A0AAV5G7T8_CORAM|nr:ribonucleotide-diphosphate reductase subunit beta [Corynebacterium ammoniagenes DSM 20306]AQS73652.1 class 1b ribonucleoside-diphosphate reductase subunit beta [Corynebacterium ammoniagenes]EFG82312.1 ribonucleoside-diphosphate reductase, beta subunit [Corynebacterium ammoniagenes DSM 20306]GJN42417.1 ribonucleoside-diphosphate reductase subunit beta [Corynebacterium ammoniagenes]